MKNSTKISTRFSRRSFLHGLGASTALLPVLHTVPALGASPRFPKRLICVSSGNGVISKEFWPQDGTFNLPAITKPLEPYKTKIILPEGISNAAAERNPVIGLSSHDSYPSLFTGAYAYLDDPPKDNTGRVKVIGSQGASIDQYIAAKITGTPLPTLTLAVMVQWGSGHQARQSYKAGPRGYQDPFEDPWKVYEKLFATGGMAGSDLDKLRAERKSVLDVVGRQLTRFGKRLGSEDRQKVEAHLGSLRDIERQLVALNAPAAGTCTPPLLGAKVGVQDMKNFPAVCKLQADLLVAAMACDMTRSGSLQWHGAAGDPLVFHWLGPEFVGKGDEYPIRQHHDITHRQNQSPDHTRRKIRVEQWFMEQLAYLLGRLDAIPEGDGTMLDNTIVLYSNLGFNGGAHSVSPMPMVLAGGTGYFKSGRHLKFNKVPHNRILLSIADAMGAPTPTFGVAELCKDGPLDELRA